MGYLLPVVFAVATALPVFIVAWILAFSAGEIGKFYGRVKTLERCLSIVVGVVFIIVGIYQTYQIYV